MHNKRIVKLYNPVSVFLNMYANSDLILQLTKRDVISKYRGSLLGLIWTFLTPILMLLIYTYVFGEIFKAKWNPNNDSKAEFALILFCGLITFNLFAEVINRSHGIIISHANYVKKVVFPLEILPITLFGSALFQGLISYFILILSLIVFLGSLHWTIIFLPLVLFPLFLLSLGLGWLIASLGVFFRDLGQIIGLALQALMLLSPIFYPASLIPKNLQFILYLNPLNYIIDDVRRVVVWGLLPQWNTFLLGFCINLLVFILGYMWFQKTRTAFADVL